MTEKTNNEVIIYQTNDGLTRVEVRFEANNLWLTLEQIAELFQKGKSTVNEHILNIFNEGELDKNVVMRKIGISDFSTKPTNLYNLDVIIAVGYRVKSTVGTHFRQWATARLKEYIQKGFTMDDTRLKNLGGGIYWQELLARIRDIRSSEKVFYRQILDIYATSVDYDPKAAASQKFFKTVQNKMHYAVHKNTAAELIYERADGNKPFSGMTTWSGDLPKLNDAVIAKNYLSDKELARLNRLTTAFLEQAEYMAEEHIPMHMKDWVETLNDMLKRMRSNLLDGAGKISNEQAEDKAKSEFIKYKKRTSNELTQVERDYLESISKVQKQLEKAKKR
ncbi:MAG: virulence RhuM family protein [Endomicrobia bacterium]|nr:virulence RhuM family protein [Endomicrobiia bacterium]